jgi:hypothetical protein
MLCCCYVAGVGTTEGVVCKLQGKWERLFACFEEKKGRLQVARLQVAADSGLRNA